MRHTPIRIGTAAWSISKHHAAQFAGGGTHLERYARVLPAVEINSSFYRPHLPKTYARWAASTPPDFRFALKLPKEITHQLRLAGVERPLDLFLEQSAALANKRGPLLIQLPPSLKFTDVAARFFALLRQHYDGMAVCEPRHATWFTAAPEKLLREFRVARVAADPAVVPAAAEPGGWPGLCYFRLHGAPRMYWSDYSDAQLDALAQRIRAAAPDAETWCIFDNTAEGHATGNALALLRRLDKRKQ